MVIISNVLFYAITVLAGYWLYVNRGSNFTNGHYTVKRFLPWMLGYMSTATMILNTHRELINLFGNIVPWIIHLGYFAVISLIYRTLMKLVKNVAIYSDDAFTNTSEGFFTWLHHRNESKVLFYEFYDEPEWQIDDDVAGYFLASTFLTTIIIMFFTIS